MEASSIGSGQEGQNLNDLQHYFVHFNKEIKAGEHAQLDISAVHLAEADNDTAVYVSTTTDGETAENVGIQEFYTTSNAILETNSEEASLPRQEEPVPEHTTIELDSTQAEIVAKMTGVDIEQNNQLSSVHAQLANLSGTRVTEGSEFISEVDNALAVATNSSNEIKRIIRVVSVGGEEMQIEEASLQVIADDADLGEQQLLASGALGMQQISVDGTQLLSADEASRAILQQNVDSSNPVAVLASVAANTANATNNIASVSEAEIHNAQLVALQNSEDSSQPHLVAVQSADGCTPHTLHVIDNSVAPNSANSFLMPSGGANYQTVTIMPSDNSQGGEVSYVLIVSQGDGDKELSVYDFKEEAREITEEIIEEDGTTKRIMKITPKKMIHSNQTHLMCQYCNYTSPKHYLLTRHMKSHSEDRPHKCDVCQRSFKTTASLQNHKNTHIGMRPHKCKQCTGAFTTSGELVRHVRYKHTFEKPHKCKVCEYASVELSKLKRHMRSHTGERPYRCEFCSYASPDTYKLKRHLRTHTGEKPYQCEICRARFTQSNSLKAHKLIHSGTKPIFQCDLCPTTCGRKTDLKIHMQKLHTSEQPLCCRKCNKTFPDRYSHKLHTKTHEGEKCFKCEHCNYAALSRRHLDSHLLTHSGLKPFECIECDQSFRQKQLLKRHKNLYHTPDYTPPMPKEKTHECKECDKTFVHKGNLKRHLSHHDSEDESVPKEVTSKMPASNHLTTQQVLQGNLLTDLREGKLGTGPIPQVVIVHPDGRVEEVTSKLQEVHDADQAASQAETKSMDDILLAMEVTADAMNPTGSDINVSEINIEAINRVAQMKEASTQVELESDYESDLGSEESVSAVPLNNNNNNHHHNQHHHNNNIISEAAAAAAASAATVTVIPNPLIEEDAQQTLSNGNASMITLTTLSSELTLPNGEKEDNTSEILKL